MAEKINPFAAAVNLFAREQKHLALTTFTPSPPIKTGIWVFDYVTACGGLPRKRLIEFHGKESSGKTTVSLYAAVNAQKAGDFVLFLDFEQAFDPVYAQALGLDLSPENCFVSQPVTLEEGEAVARHFYNISKETGRPVTTVLDSLPAMVPAKMRDNLENIPKLMGLQSRLQGAFLSDLTTWVRMSDGVGVILNQMRANIQTMPMAHAPADKNAGGYAFKHYISQSYHLKISKKESVVDDSPDGTENKREAILHVTIKNKKNKVGQAHRSGVMYMIPGLGIDNTRYAVEAAVAKKIIKKSGAWFKNEDLGINAQGMSKLMALLAGNEQLLECLLIELGWLKDGVIDLSPEDDGSGLITEEDEEDEE